MTTETNKTSSESEHCTCNKSCPIHTEVESSIEDQLEYIQSEEGVISIITTGIITIVFALIFILYIKIFGIDDIIYIKNILFYEEYLRPIFPFLTAIALGMLIIGSTIIYGIVYIFVKEMIVYIRDKFSFDLIYTF